MSDVSGTQQIPSAEGTSGPATDPNSTSTTDSGSGRGAAAGTVSGAGDDNTPQSATAGGESASRSVQEDPSKIDPQVPANAKEVPIEGVIPAENASFKEQVQGHAKMFAGKIFRNDEEVQKGAARIRGLEQGQQGSETQQQEQQK